ncbi:MAG: GNAT family N-acetyltransferase [Pseudomonadota bacterium]
MRLTVHPLTPDRWTDLETLFGEASATRNCWCMWWRVAGNAWKDTTKASRKQAFRGAADDTPPGLLGYDGDTPVAWVHVTPRADVPRFNNGRMSKPNDDYEFEHTWAISCFYTKRSHRKQGIMAAMARAACYHAQRNGAFWVEAAPIRPKPDLQRSDGYFGIVPALERAGFDTVEERGPNRILMRWIAVNG